MADTQRERIFVTGGTGFVGRSLIRWLRASQHPLAGAQLAVLTRSPAAFARDYPQLAREVELLEGDVRSFSFPPGTFTHILHGATDTSMAAHARTQEMMDTIIEGTRRVLAFATQASVPQLVFLSSGAVYGPQPAELAELPEDYVGQLSPEDPATAYGRAKRVAEEQCLEWGTKSGRTGTVARLFAFIGEELPLDAHFAIGNFLRDALAQRPIEVKGDGTPVRSYLHAFDLSEWLGALLLRRGGGRTFNVGSDEAIDMASLARLVAEVVSPGLAVTVARARADYAGRHRYVPSIARITQDLGVQLRWPLREAIAQTADAHRRRALSIRAR